MTHVPDRNNIPIAVDGIQCSKLENWYGDETQNYFTLGCNAGAVTFNICNDDTCSSCLGQQTLTSGECWSEGAVRQAGAGIIATCSAASIATVSAAIVMVLTFVSVTLLL